MGEAQHRHEDESTNIDLKSREFKFIIGPEEMKGSPSSNSSLGTIRSLHMGTSELINRRDPMISLLTIAPRVSVSREGIDLKFICSSSEIVSPLQ